MSYSKSKEEIQQRAYFDQLKQDVVKYGKKIPVVKEVSDTVTDFISALLGVPVMVIVIPAKLVYKYGYELPKEIKEKFIALETFKKVASYSVKATNNKLTDCTTEEQTLFNKYYHNWREGLENTLKIIGYIVEKQNLEVFRLPGTNSYQINLYALKKMQDEGVDIEYFLNNIRDPFLVELDKKHMMDKLIKNSLY